MFIPGERKSARKRRGVEEVVEQMEGVEEEGAVGREKLPSELMEEGGVELDDSTFQKVSWCDFMEGVGIMSCPVCSARRC